MFQTKQKKVRRLMQKHFAKVSVPTKTNSQKGSALFQIKRREHPSTHSRTHCRTGKVIFNRDSEKFRKISSTDSEDLRKGSRPDLKKTENVPGMTQKIFEMIVYLIQKTERVPGMTQENSEKVPPTIQQKNQKGSLA